MNSTCTLLNYPGFTFTEEQLLGFQDHGVKFNCTYESYMSDYNKRKTSSSSCGFSDHQSMNYFVLEFPENKSLFEKLAGINQVNQVNQKKTKPRVHADLIKAWVEDDSLVIEYLDKLELCWYAIEYPSWNPCTVYRIKPSVDPEVISKGLSQGISTCKAMLVLSEEV
jgi:hypothetical protein